MGVTIGKAFTSFFQENELKIVVFGLDGTGKSSILHRLKTGETLTSDIPTIVWKHYFQEVSGIVFVVDSTDIDRIEEATNFLDMVIEKIQGIIPDNVAVLVYGNKYEVPGAMSASKISNKLDLTSLRQRNWQRNWHVQSSRALTGHGLHEGLDWLLKNAGKM